MQNPFLNTECLPKFDMFHVEHIEPAIEQLLTESQKKIDELVDSKSAPSWVNFIEELEAVDNRIEKVWGLVGHLDAVKNTDEWHKAYTNCLAKMTAYHSQLGQNKGLFNKYQQLAKSSDYANYSLEQKKVVEIALRNFTLSGIDLPKEQQDKFKDVSQSLSKLSSQFANNVLKSTQAWQKNITNESDLMGLPATALDLLKQLAEQKELTGWLVTLDFPAYIAIMTHADSASLREEVYKAYSTRASDQADDSSFDNSDNILQILKNRQKKARLLGFANYAELSLATKMAASPAQVNKFIYDLAKQSKKQAKEELAKLTDFARKLESQKSPGVGSVEFVLNPWDITYYSEKYKKEILSLSQETLRPYFPVEKALSGLFEITWQLFDTKVAERFDVAVWHEDVRFFDLLNSQDEVIASFYLDLYARENKRGGAWMDTVVSRWKTTTGKLQKPVAYLVCNFTPAVADAPACLTHNEVTTLFHEFGHGLHHMLTQMEHFDVSGIKNVPWDAVEFPSQFMENFCWTREGLDLITGHVDTGETLPDNLLASLQKSRGFQSAMMMLRQLEFGLFDMLVHSGETQDVLVLAKQVREQISVVKPPSYNRFPQSFSHIFAGGYAAGYYSYKWAEVLSADAFSLFEEQGILNPATGEKFKNTVLAAGGSVDPMVLFKKLRGREPEIEALLRHSAISSATT